MRSFERKFFATISLCILGSASAASAEEIQFEIISEIRDVSAFSFQVGEKSRQKVTIDFERQRASSSATTGVTQVVPGWDWGSVRDGFGITSVEFAKTKTTLKIFGQTGSAVQFMPDIDYQFTLIVNRAQRKMWLSGCHNEFPSYQITFGEKLLYDRQQSGDAFTGLVGVCDIVVNEEISF